jgi:tRNA pseudouridine55 synthase
VNEEKSIIVNVFKGGGITSQGVVTAVKKALNVKTAGHCGTLDPLATGVLPVMVGRAVKASEYLTDHDKTYRATMKLGLTTDTGDITGKVLSEYEGKIPELAQVKSVIPDFIGEITQVPPMYSALKVDGHKLVDLARMGVEVERKGRKITVYSLEAYMEDGEIVLDVMCSRGTYIRTLIEDIGKSLGCGAIMTSLCRTSVGEVEYSSKCCKYLMNSQFSVENSVTVEELKNGILPEKAVIAVESVFEKYKALSFPQFYERLFMNGCEIYIKKLPAESVAKTASEGDVFRIIGENGFFALGEVRQYEDGLAVKQIKRF